MFKKPVLAVLLALAAATSAFGFDVLPTVTVLEMPRDARGTTITITNPRTVALPINVEIVERTINEDGTEVYAPADDQFRVFPEQAVLQPGGRQAVRVIFTGQVTDKSRSFTLFASEVPVDLTASGQSGVQRILRIGASVHVAPAGTSPMPRVVEAKPEGTGVRLTLANDGTRFVYMNDLSISFGNKTLTGEEVAQAASRTLLPPGGRRTFVVPNVSGTPQVKLAI